MNIPHPYEGSYKPEAWVGEDGYFYLRGKTYPIRKLISQLGGSWSPKLNCWICSVDTIKSLLKEERILVMIRVKVPEHCHEKAETISASHKEVEYGYMMLGCGWCDTTAICGDAIKIDSVVDTETAELFDIKLGGN